MSDQNKDSLENFFKDRAQRHNLEFNEGDWQKLEEQLDKEMPVTFMLWAFLKRFWVIPLLVFLIPVSWLGYKGFVKNDQPQKEQIEQEIASTGQIDIKESEVNRALEEKTFGSATNDNEGMSEEDISGEKPVQAPNYTINQNQKSVNDQDLFVESKTDGLIDNKNNDLGYVFSEEGATSGLGIRNSRLPFLLPIAPVPSQDPGIINVDFMEANAELELNPKNTFKFTLSVGLGYSPDFSTVGLENFVSPGSRWKFLAEVGISQRFSINTGLVLVKNKYTAYGEDYHAPSGYWHNGIVAEESYGECDMIDIPLNIRYNVITRDKHQVFISGGASTYLVLKEDYYFSYDQPDPSLPSYWGTDKMTKYPFGIINFSLGYQYDFKNKSGLQIEPFIKIPTGGVGWGEVDLHTIGVYFMYRYQIIK